MVEDHLQKVMTHMMLLAIGGDERKDLVQKSLP